MEITFTLDFAYLMVQLCMCPEGGSRATVKWGMSAPLKIKKQKK